jgi:hypothetical protein
MQKEKCKLCKREMSDQEILDCDKIKFIHFCHKCLPLMQAQLEKCKPLFQKMSL